AHRANQSRDIAAAAGNNRKLGSCGWALVIVCVNGRARLSIQSVVEDISDYSDDRKQMEIAIHIAKLNLFANRIFVRPMPADERLTYDRYVRRIGPVALRKKATAQDWNIHRGEISSTGCAIVCVPGSLCR